MSVYGQLWNYLLGQVPELDAPLSQSLVQQAWADIRGEKTDWSFLTKEIVISVPNAIGNGIPLFPPPVGGTVAVVNGSPTVVPDATAKTLLDASPVPLAGQVFRGGGAGGPVYIISGYDPSGAGALTLDRPYYELSNPATTYLIYMMFVTVPSSDFERYVVLRDPINGYNLRMDWTRREIDLMDPQRGATGNPWYIVSKDYDGNGLPRHELWPGALTARAYQGLYQRAGLPLSDTADLPFIIRQDLVQERALVRAYEWAEANKGRHASLKDTDWRFLMNAALARYSKILQQVKIKDDEIYNSQWAGSYLEQPGGFPIDAKLLQQVAPYGPS